MARKIRDLFMLKTLVCFLTTILPDHHWPLEQGLEPGDVLQGRTFNQNVLLLLHGIGCSKFGFGISCEKLCICSRIFLDSATNILKRSCPLKLCFKTAFGLGAAQAVLGLKVLSYEIWSEYTQEKLCSREKDKCVKDLSG